MSLSPHSRGLPGSCVDTLNHPGPDQETGLGGEADPAVTMGQAAAGLGHRLGGRQ